jgi:hypothetical protein
MSYSDSRFGRVTGAAVLFAPVALQTPADLGAYQILGAVTAYRIGLLITTLMTVSNAVLSFDIRPTPGSDTGRVAAGVGTITVPFGAAPGAVGLVYYKDVTVDLNPGDEVVVKLTAGSTAGAGIPIFETSPRDANPGDFVEMKKSA